jgi:hypothetical protein
LKSDSDIIKERLDAMPDCFDWLKQLALRYLGKGCRLQEGCIRLGRFRKYDHDHFHITIFPPAEPDWLVERRSFEVPLDYLKLLSHMNGLRLFEMRLFGFTPSMQGSFPRLDRSRLQCLDLTAANETWTIDMKNAPGGFIYFGSGFYSSKENKEFFMNEAGNIRALLKRGIELGGWPSLWALIAQEGAAEEQRVMASESDV